MSRFQALGNNALALLVLLVFFLMIYARMTGKSISEIVSDISGKMKGDR